MAAWAALLTLLVVPAASAAPGAATAGGVSATVSAGSFRLGFAVGAATVATEAVGPAGPGARLSYQLADGSVHTVTTLLAATPRPQGTDYLVATDEPGRRATLAVRRVETGMSVDFTLEPATGVTTTFEAFAATPGEHFLGGGERNGSLDLSGQALAVKTSNSCGDRMPAPFFLSSAGYGVSLDSSTIAGLAFPGADPSSECAGGSELPCPLAAHANVVQICAKGAELQYDLFTGTPDQIVSSYAKTVGLPLLPPVSQFGLIKWRDAVSGPADLFADVHELHALHIPIGWILLDNPWESDLCYGEMAFDASRFPDPAGMIQQLHARGVRFMLWISPLVRRQWCPPPSQYSPRVLFGSGNAYTIDLTDPTTLATFEQSLRSLIALGVDGFKADRGDEIDLESMLLAGGSGTTLQNLYPLLYARAVAAAVQDAGRTGRFATLFRAGAPGSSSLVPGFWGGDQLGTFDGLRQAIHDGLSAGVAGYPVWGSDVGGYANAAPEPVLTPEVFVRWAQFGAVSPIFEVGGTGTSATFWDFGKSTVDAFRRAAVLHYELFPYLYQLAETAHESGLPILRPLALEHPDDPNAWRYDLEALVGRDLLAAPVTEPAVPGGYTDASVYLPSGSWLDLATGTVRAGGGSPFVRPTPLDQLPLYLRAGAAIPFAARTPQLWSRAWPTDALQMPGRGGWLYAPARGASLVRSSRFGRFSARMHGRVVELRLAGAPRQTQVLVAGRQAPVDVRIDGRLVPRARSVAALRRARSGWMPVGKPFPGVVLKLAPRGGVARAELKLG